MFRTTLNVVDDMAVTTAVAHWETPRSQGVRLRRGSDPCSEAGATPA